MAGGGRAARRIRWDGGAVRATSIAFCACLLLLATAAPARAQLGSLLSPGKLSKPHAGLEGIKNCQSCHEQGRKVTAEKCLACHKPVAERIARKTGVHKNVKGDCVSCHAEHAGVDGHLRPFDQARFDHTGVTGFALDGRHAPLAQQCAACHRARSFLTLAPACASCHTDVHKGTLGTTCTKCHSTRTVFKELSGQFDHAQARFALAGAHLKVVCESCHVNRVFRGLKFSTCADCHKDPHLAGFGPACATCHTNETFRTKKVDHAKTAFALVGKHTAVACALCHKQPAMQVKPKSDSCAACHVDVHKGTFKQDCKSCHSENGFAKGQFDHGKTAFPLTEKHATVTCTGCHTGVALAGVPLAKKTADFRGLKTACASCHLDVHRAELGQACDTCHSPKSFKLTAFTHPRYPEFYAGQHAPVVCDKCHKGMAAKAAVTSTLVGKAAPATVASFKNTPTACASCHKDVHLGQVGKECQTCHSIPLAKFGVANFSHDKTPFPLTGRHVPVACVKCHKSETGSFPAGAGTAIRFKGIAHECRTCHQDLHLGQFAAGCATCHTTTTFKFTSYTHTNRALAKTFFVGRHVKAACAACHKPVTADFPAGRGTAVRFKLDARCVTCHEDVHRGSLGNNCLECHKP